jgi:hypothetical protein
MGCGLVAGLLRQQVQAPSERNFIQDVSPTIPCFVDHALFYREFVYVLSFGFSLVHFTSFS